MLNIIFLANIIGLLTVTYIGTITAPLLTLVGVMILNCAYVHTVKKHMKKQAKAARELQEAIEKSGKKIRFVKFDGKNFKDNDE